MNSSAGILLSEDSIFLRAASSFGVRSEVTALTKKRYEWRGYQAPSSTPQPNTMVLSVEDPETGSPIGTIGSRIDGIEGLGCDEAFSDVVDTLRGRGLRLAEFVGLATEPNSPLAALGALFHSAFLFATQVEEADFILMEVNPRHRGVYTRSLKFDVLSEVRTCQRASAPALLLGQHKNILENCALELGALRGTGSSKSILSYFFTPEKALDVRQRLFGPATFKPLPRTIPMQWMGPRLCDSSSSAQEQHRALSQEAPPSAADEQTKSG